MSKPTKEEFSLLLQQKLEGILFRGFFAETSDKTLFVIRRYEREMQSKFGELYDLLFPHVMEKPAPITPASTPAAPAKQTLSPATPARPNGNGYHMNGKN